jgi:hypothetical protein
MDPITVAIVAALAKLSDTVVKDAYEALKGLLHRKFSGEKGVAEAVSNLEREPASAGRKEVLKEKVAASGADRDEEVLRAVQTLNEKVRALPGGSQVIQQTVTGDNNVVAGTGNVTITYGKE